MEKKLAMRWVKNLRSKKFKQTTGTLCRTEVDADDLENVRVVGYCCLGVLAETCGVDKALIRSCEALDGEEFGICQMKDEEGKPTVGTVKVRKTGNGYTEYATLASANDAGVSFRSIASWIEKNYKRL